MAKVLAACLAALALMAAAASPASADVLRPAESGEPVLSGKLHGEEEHGVIHCRPIAEIIGQDPQTATGVIVVRPGERWLLAAPNGGGCEAIFEGLGG